MKGRKIETSSLRQVHGAASLCVGPQGQPQCHDPENHPSGEHDTEFYLLSTVLEAKFA
jgi:hypothetical protein